VHCAYIVSRYPAPTHTFIVREVRALRAAGLPLDTVSIRRAADGDVLSPVDEEERQVTHALRPTTVATLWRGHSRALGHSPWAYLRTLLGALRLAGPDARALLLRRGHPPMGVGRAPGGPASARSFRQRGQRRGHARRPVRKCRGSGAWGR